MSNLKQQWDSYCERELALLVPILRVHGFSLDTQQPHLQGERFLQQAVTTASGKKLILYGLSKDNKKVVIKATSDPDGIRELTHERTCRKFLLQINFAASVFHTPCEVDWIDEKGFVISIQEFIEQEKTFLERSLEEQFSLALSSFKAQEGAHATTYGHIQRIKGIYENRDAKIYLHNFANFIQNIKILIPEETKLLELLKATYQQLQNDVYTIEQYCGFLTHTDFVPHNLRISANNTIYLLDHSSLTFGNKYEGWARFLNFMSLHNPPLTRTLTQYVHDNRTQEESSSLRVMRLYRLGEIIFYYAKAYTQSDGDLKILNHTRVDFWSTILSHILLQKEIPESVIVKYKNQRDQLRTQEEKMRQKGLH